MARFTRRDFLKTSLAAGVLSGAGGAALAQTAKRSATDWVTLGKSNVKVTRLAPAQRGGLFERIPHAANPAGRLSRSLLGPGGAT